MSFGFSAGDFIAAISLVGKIIGALNNINGAASEYKELISQLYTLESVLIQVKTLQVEDEQRPQLAALRQAAGQCQATLDHFMTKCLQGYEKHLSQNTSGTSLRKVKKGYSKAKRGVLEQDDLAKFKANVAAHTASINMLLLTVQS
jgi:hypothetical protein